MVSPNPGLLAAFLKTGRLNGVLRWKVLLDEDTVKQECLSAGWRSQLLDTHGAKTLTELLQVAVTELDLSRTASESITSFEEALRVVMISDAPVCITWLGWQDIISSSPDDAGALVGMFEDILNSHPGLVLIAGHQGTFPRVDELALA